MPELTLDTIDLVGEDFYQQNGYPHEAWALLRREAPVHWYERDGLDPFWAITRHADIVQISRAPRRWIIEPRLAVFPELTPPEGEPNQRHLLTMDPPEHAAYRKLVSAHFTPRALRRMDPRVEEITRQVVDEFARSEEGDFVTGMSMKLPVILIAELLGVPEEDWERLFRWTNETIGASDPEYQLEGESAADTAERARLAAFEYFMQLAEKRRAEPREDLISVLARAEIEGRPLPPLELLSYFFLLMVAGNETTRNAITGGMLALLEHPDQLERLRADPDLLDPAVEEIVRWVTPVIQFCRTATEDTRLRGQTIRAGQNVCLFYASGNRDDEVFDDPFAFRIDRRPNPHLGFGIGEHFCLGANLARRELRALFRELIPRLERMELAGPVERLRSSFVGGVKRMPVAYRVAH